MVVRSLRIVWAPWRLLDSARRIARTSMDLRDCRRESEEIWGFGGREGSMVIVLEEAAADSGSKRWVRTVASFVERSTVVILEN